MAPRALYPLASVLPEEGIGAITSSSGTHGAASLTATHAPALATDAHVSICQPSRFAFVAIGQAARGQLFATDEGGPFSRSASGILRTMRALREQSQVAIWPVFCRPHKKQNLHLSLLFFFFFF